MGLSTLPESADESIWDELRTCQNLPTPPGVAARLINLAQREDATFEQVEEVVKFDPVMTAKLLKLANSSFYSRGQTTADLKQAIRQFGLNGTLIIALTFSLVEIPDAKKSTLDYNKFWLHSLASATICKKLAQLSSAGNKESFYLAGLIQDIGALALVTVRPDIYDSANAESLDHNALVSAEQSALGIDHSDIGAWLLEEWEFPQIYVDSTRNSHALDPDASMLSSVVSVSSHLAGLWSSPEIDLPDELVAIVNDQIEIDEELIPQLLTDTATEISEVAHLFGVEELENTAIQTLLAEAKESLTLRSLMTQKLLVDTTRRMSDLEQQTLQLEQKLDYDALTGVHTRSYAYRVLDREFLDGTQPHCSISIIFVDLDDFKQVNDQHGHRAGDVVLKGAATVLKNSLRSNDVIARIGGEEFLIILLNTEYEAASLVCDRLVENLSSTNIKVDSNSDIRTTASIGLSVHCEQSRYSSIQKLIDVADAGCYEAKNSGKNRWIYKELES